MRSVVRVYPDPPVERARARKRRSERERGHSSAGRAPALHAGGRRFDPVWLHQRGGFKRGGEEKEEKKKGRRGRKKEEERKRKEVGERVLITEHLSKKRCKVCSIF